MATSSILGGERAATHVAGRDVNALGPSDSSDSGSDIQGDGATSSAGPYPLDHQSDSDRNGTGERGAAVGSDSLTGADILPDQITQPQDEDALLETRDGSVEDLVADADPGDSGDDATDDH